MTLPDSIPAALLLSAPLLLAGAGLVPASLANRHPAAMGRLVEGAAALVLLVALAATLALSLTGAGAWSLASWPLPGGLGALSLSVYLNALTLVMLFLVSLVGLLVARFARNYLQGEAHQGRFYKWLALTLAAILTLIVTGNLLVFALAWTATSLSLHQLLLFYRNRPIAVRSAHKKFIVSRLGEACLFAAVLLMGLELHTLEFRELAERMAAWEDPLPWTLQLAALLVVVTAALKSAQIPFHGWLLQVMEAPTPVSALLHAGIVNAGAFVVLRMSPVLAQAEAALALLALIGLVTLAVASLCMLAQTSIKVSLAWSTVAQMGFMLLECGLGLYELALLHLVTHSLYKAHAFLASGSGVDAYRAPQITKPPVAGGAPQLFMALALGTAVVTALALSAGVNVGGQPALLAVSAVVAIALAQLLLLAWQEDGRRVQRLAMVGLALGLGAAYFALHEGFARLLAGSVTPVADTATTPMLVLSLLTVAVFLALVILQQILCRVRTPLSEALYVHLYNGFYIDTWVMRALQALWPAPSPRTSNPPTTGGL